jgi:hypothetical protein
MILIPQVFCYNCVVNHLHLNFEETLNDPTFKCLPCHEKCCCCKTECTINHRHCFTYIRTKKRYEKARQWKEKNRGDDGDGGSNSDQSEDGDLSGSGPIQNGMMSPGMAGTFSAFSPQSGNKFNINGNSYANPMLPGPNPDFYTPTRPLGMPLPNNGQNMQSNGPMLYRGPNDPSFNQTMNMRSPNSFNYAGPGMPTNGSPFMPAIPNSVPMPNVNGSPNTQPKNPNNNQQPSPGSQNMPFYNPAQGGFMPFRRPVSQTGFDDDPSPKRLKTSHNGSPSANAWPPLVSNIGESQSNGNGQQGALMMPPMSNNPNLPYFPFPGTSSPFMNSLGGAPNGNPAQQLIKSDVSSPANENHGNGSPQLPKPTRPNDQSQNNSSNTLREEPYRNYMLPPTHLPFFGRPWDDTPVKEQSNGALSLSGILHNSTGSTSSAGEGSGPGNKDNKSGVVEMNGHHAMMNGHNFSAQSHLAHHNDLNEAQNGKGNAHDSLHGELTAL